MSKPKKFQAYYQSPLGWLKVEGAGRALTSMDFVLKKPVKKIDAMPLPAQRQLDQYFRRERKKFSLRLMPIGTVFQKKVWNALQTIPYGKKVAYREVATTIGCPQSVRAVARAIGQNKFPIVIPCHRVIGSNGSLTGYAYGLKKKAWLLDHEQGL